MSVGYQTVGFTGTHGAPANWIGRSIAAATARNLDIPLLLLAHAAEGDPDCLSTYATRFLGCEECDHLGYFLRRTIALIAK